MTATPNTLGGTVRSLRLQKRLTLRELAQRIGVSPTYLLQIEKNERRPTSERIHSLAAALDFAPDTLHILAGRIPDDIHCRLLTDRTLLAQIRRTENDPLPS
jgi:transcriptional regulator with XRE-family HTH domain